MPATGVAVGLRVGGAFVGAPVGGALGEAVGRFGVGVGAGGVGEGLLLPAGGAGVEELVASGTACEGDGVEPDPPPQPVDTAIATSAANNKTRVDITS